MEAVTPTSSAATQSPGIEAANPRGYADLTGDDFMQMLIQEITNQDPLEPTDNKDILSQINSIRELEQSETLTGTLESLTTSLGETVNALKSGQGLANGGSMIGQYVSGVPAEGEEPVSGMVVGVRNDAAGGQAVLVLSTGEELPIDQVSSVTTMEGLAESLVGREIRGVDLRDPAQARDVEGLVTAVRTGDTGDILLELDTGEDLRLQDVTNVSGTVAEAPGFFEELIDKTSQLVKQTLGLN